MTGPAYEVHCDWNADGDFTDVGEVPIGRVLDRGTPLSIEYGRDQARAFAPLAPGRAQFEIDNTSRDYSPENTASPLAGNVLPGRTLRVQATFGGTTYGLIRGHLDGYEVLPDLEQRCVQFSVSDAIARLKDVRVSTELHHSVRTGAAIGLLLDAAGWDPALRDLDVGATTMPWWWVDNTDAYEALQQILDSEGPGCLASVDIDGRIVFRDRHHRITRTASTTVQATFRASGVEPCISPPMVYDHGWSGIVNSVTFSVPVRAPSGELSAVWSMQGTHAIADGQTVLLSAASSNPFMGAVVPEAGTDFILVSGTVTLTLSRTSGLSTTVFVKATGGPAVIADLQVRAYPIVTTSTVQVSAEDSTSIGLPGTSGYGRRSWPSDRDPVFAGLPDAIAIADIILAHRAQRLPTVTITLKGGNSVRLVQQLARDLSDRVRIVEPETGLDADFYVEQIRHTISVDHMTVFGCEKVPTISGTPFMFDVTGRGFNDGAFGSIGRDDPATVFIFDHATQGKFDVGMLGT